MKKAGEKVSLKRSLIYGLIAGIIYFTIAFIANTGHQLEQRLISSIGHGFLCMCMTFISTTMMEFFFNSFKTNFTRYFGCLFFSGLISATLMISVHLLLGTPEILKTLLASGVTSIPYYLLFPLQLLFEAEESSNKFKYREDQNWDRFWAKKRFANPYYLRDFFKVLWLNLYLPSRKNPAQVESLSQSFVFEKNLKPKYRICFLGDLMPMYKYEWKIDESLIHFLKDVDYLVGNLEGVVELDNFGGLLGMAHKLKFLEDLAKVFPPSKTILSVANNHSADFGKETFYKSCSILEERGFKLIGKRDKANYIIDEKN